MFDSFNVRALYMCITSLLVLRLRRLSAQFIVAPPNIKNADMKAIHAIAISAVI